MSSSVGIFVSAKQAQQSFGLVVRPELPRCLGESVVRSGAPGHITLRSAGKLAFPKLRDRSQAYRVVFAVKSGNQQVPATIDLVAINKGAVERCGVLQLGRPAGARELRAEDRRGRRSSAA